MTLTEQTLRLSLKGSPEKQLRMAQKRPDVDLPMIFWLVIVGVVVLPVVASVSLAR